jgi:hypothetical protein
MEAGAYGISVAIICCMYNRGWVVWVKGSDSEESESGAYLVEYCWIVICMSLLSVGSCELSGAEDKVLGKLGREEGDGLGELGLDLVSEVAICTPGVEVCWVRGLGE